MRLLLTLLLLAPTLALAQNAPPLTRSGPMQPSGVRVSNEADVLAAFRLKADSARLDAEIARALAAESAVVTSSIPLARVDLGDTSTPFWDHYGTPVMRLATQGGTRNGLVSIVRNNAPAGTFAFPTAITGTCLMDSPGGDCFALYTEARIRTNGVATTEFAAMNDSGLAPDPTLPPNRALGTMGVNPVSVTISCGGNADCSIGTDYENEGSSVPRRAFLYNSYMAPTSATLAGQIIDATSESGPLHPQIVRGTGLAAVSQFQIMNGIMPGSTHLTETLSAAGAVTSFTTIDGTFQNAGGALTPGGGYVGKTQTFVPASGDIVQVATAVSSVVIDPPASIAAVTVNFPAVPVDGQRMDLVCGQSIASLTVRPVFGQVSRFQYGMSCSPDAGRSFRYSAGPNAWFRSY